MQSQINDVKAKMDHVKDDILSAIQNLSKKEE